MRQTLTYGQLPTNVSFYEAFDAECPDGKFAFGNDKRVGTDKLSADQLWNELSDAVEEGTDESLEWASCVLSALSFEWV